MNSDACSGWPFSFYHGLALHYEALVGKWLLKPTEPSTLGLMSAEFTLKTGTIILTIQRCPCKIQLEKRSIVYIVCTALPMSCDSRAVIDVELLQRCRQRRVIVDLEELAQEIWKWMEMWRETRILDNTQNEKKSYYWGHAVKRQENQNYGKFKLKWSKIILG